MHYRPWGDSAVEAIFSFILIYKKQNVTATVCTAAAAAADVLNAFQRQLQSTEKSLTNIIFIRILYNALCENRSTISTARYRSIVERENCRQRRWCCSYQYSHTRTQSMAVVCDV